MSQIKIIQAESLACYQDCSPALTPMVTTCSECVCSLFLSIHERKIKVCQFYMNCQYLIAHYLFSSFHCGISCAPHYYKQLRCTRACAKRNGRDCLVSHTGKSFWACTNLKYTQPVLFLKTNKQKKTLVFLWWIQQSVVSFQAAVLAMQACHGSFQCSSPASTETHNDIDRG